MDASVCYIPSYNDSQRVADYDNYTESAFQVPNPDFGRVIAYQPPRSLRIGARLAW